MTHLYCDTFLYPKQRKCAYNESWIDNAMILSKRSSML